jgi:hypothetical protein
MSTWCDICRAICTFVFVRDSGRDEVYRCTHCGHEKRETVR